MAISVRQENIMPKKKFKFVLLTYSLGPKSKGEP